MNGYRRVLVDAETGQRFLSVPELPDELTRGQVVEIDQAFRWVIVDLERDDVERMVTIRVRRARMWGRDADSER